MTPTETTENYLLLLAVSAGVAVAAAGCTPNVTWQGSKMYAPPAAQTITLSGLGVNDQVDVLATGALPLTVSRNLKNIGNKTASNYAVTDTIQLLVFSSVAGNAGYSPGPAATHTLFTCSVPGPTLAPGQEGTVTFTFPSAGCSSTPTAPVAALQCGMYLETLRADATDVLAEGSSGERDNEGRHHFLVPSSQPPANIETRLNPNADGNIRVVPVRRVEVAAFRYPPPNPPAPITVNTHRVRVTQAAGPNRGYIVTGRTPVKGDPGFSPDEGALVPPTPIFVPAGGPTVLNYAITFDPRFIGPDLDILSFYFERLDTKVTAITTDGCNIRQSALLTTVVHEEHKR